MRLKLLVFVFGLSLLPIASALNNCDGLFLRGDANGNLNLDIADAISSLSYLFLGGFEISCLERGDVDGNGRIDINDPKYLLNYLFLGGPGPRDMSGDYQLISNGDLREDGKYLKLHALGSGPVILGFVGIDNDLTFSDIPSVFELQNLEGSLIKSCSIEVYEGDNFLSETFYGEWPLGMDLYTHPLKFVVGDDDRVIIDYSLHKYKLKATCVNMNDEYGEIELNFNTQMTNPITCREGIDICCTTPGAQGQKYLRCVADCDYIEATPRTPARDLGLYSPSCNDIPRDDSLGDNQKYHTWSNEPISSCKANDEPRTDFPAGQSACYLNINPELTKSSTIDKRSIELLKTSISAGSSDSKISAPCYIKSLTILRKQSDISRVPPEVIFPKQFMTLKEQKDYAESHNYDKFPYLSDEFGAGVQLGPTEGWYWNYKGYNGKDLGGYAIGYSFLALAELTPDSSPESCKNAQFVQEDTTRIERVLGITPIQYRYYLLYSVKEGMNSYDEIKKTSLSVLKVLSIEDIEDSKVKKEIDIDISRDDGKTFKNELSEKDNEIFKRIKSETCSFGGMWCTDDYSSKLQGKYRLLPSNLEASIGILRIKIFKHEKNPADVLDKDRPPYLAWYDMPEINAPREIMVPSARNPPPFYPLEFIENRNLNFIMIAEEPVFRPKLNPTDISYQYRWICEMNNLGFKNKRDPSLRSWDPAIDVTSIKRFDYAEPSCFCIQQRRAENGPFEDLLNTKTTC